MGRPDRQIVKLDIRPNSNSQFIKRVAALLLAKCSRSQRLDICSLFFMFLMFFVGNLSNLQASAVPAILIQQAALLPATQAEEISEQQQTQIRNRHILNQLLYRQIRNRWWLLRVERLHQQGKTDEALLTLQEIIGKPNANIRTGQDSFVWNQSKDHIVTLNQQIARLFDRFDQATLNRYEELCGHEAKIVFDQALAHGDEQSIRDVTRYYFYTQSGFEASEWLATQLFDAGLPDQAARIWSRLIRTAAHSKRIRFHHLITALTACLVCNQTEQARTLLAEVKQNNARFDDLLVNAMMSATLSGLMESEQQHLLVRSSRDRKTNTKHNRTVTAPYQQPLWTRPFADNNDNLILRQINDWQWQQKQKRAPFAVANQALVTQDQVIIRNFSNISSYKLDDGTPIWSYPCATSINSIARQIQTRYGKNPEPGQVRTMLSITQSYAWNSVTGSLSCDDHHVFAIDSFDLAMPRSRHSNSKENIEEQLVSRLTNRLIALPIMKYNSAERTSSLVAAADNWPAWSIGGSADLPAWFLQNDKNQDRVITSEEFTQSSATFKKYDRDQNGEISFTEAVQPDKQQLTTHNITLQDHFFLGPPLSLANRLYVITESSRELFLNALDPRTGHLIWQQGIGYVTTPISQDHLRYGLKCTPQYAQGMILCPTQTGILVAVDPVQGNLLWMNYYGDDFAKLSEIHRRPVVRQQRYNHPGFPEKLHVQGDRIVYLPRQSEYIHCINLQSGKTVWKSQRKAPRPSGKSSIGDEYIGAVTNQLIFLVGAHRSRAIDLASGRELWTLKTGSPAGIGLLADHIYLLPNQSGNIEQIDLQRGAIVNPDQIWHPPSEGETDLSMHAGLGRVSGHLNADNKVIVVSNPCGVSVFPQMGPLQKALSAEPDLSPDQRLLLAELHIRMGEFERGQRVLTKLKQSELVENYRIRADELLMELFQTKLRLHQGDPEKILKQWDRIATTAFQRSKYLMSQANYNLAQHDQVGLEAAIAEFAQLGMTEPIPDVQDPTHLISPGGWINFMLSQLRLAFGEDAHTEMLSLLYHLRTRFTDPLQIAQYEQLLTSLPDYSELFPVVVQHVDRLTKQKAYQQAELVLLHYKHSARPELAAWATQQLAHLWVELGLYQNAARLLPALTGQFAQRTLPGGITGQASAEHLLRNPKLHAAFHQNAPPARPVHQVAIRHQRYARQAEHLKTAYAKYNRILPTSHLTHVQVLERPRQNDEIRLAMVEKRAGVVTGNVTLPKDTHYPHQAHMQQLAHFYPIGSRGKMLGISLLNSGDAKPLWSNSPIWPNQDAYDTQTIRVGPCGPTYCVFQTQQELIVVDPATGRILWQRTRLEPDSGLFAKSYYMSGDEHVLTVFESDGVHYTTYDMRCGQVLRTGELHDVYSTRRRVFGRKLFYLSRENNELHVQVWDPLHDRIELDETVRSPRAGQVLYAPLPSGNEVAFIKPDGNLQVYNVLQARKRCEAKLKPEEFFSLNQLLAFEDDQRYYIVLQRNSRAIPAGYNTSYANDTIPLSLHVHGDLYAFDKTKQTQLWKRTLPRRTILHSQSYNLPFLISLSWITDRTQHKQQTILLEVIDAQTGELLASNADIPHARIIQTSYNSQRSQLTLRGIQQDIILDFSSPTIEQTVEVENDASSN